MTLKRIDKDVFPILFSWTFDKDVMRGYNSIDPRKVTNRNDMCIEFLQQYSCNAGIPIDECHICMVSLGFWKSFQEINMINYTIYTPISSIMHDIAYFQHFYRF